MDEQPSGKAKGGAFPNWGVVVFVLGSLVIMMLGIVLLAGIAALSLSSPNAKQDSPRKSEFSNISSTALAGSSLHGSEPLEDRKSVSTNTGNKSQAAKSEPDSAGVIFVLTAAFFILLFLWLHWLVFPPPKSFAEALKDKSRALLIHLLAAFDIGGMAGVMIGVGEADFSAHGKLGETEWRVAVGAGVGLAICVFVILRRESRKEDNESEPLTGLLLLMSTQLGRFWNLADKLVDTQHEVVEKSPTGGRQRKRPLTMDSHSIIISNIESVGQRVATAGEIEKALLENRREFEARRPKLWESYPDQFALIRGSEITCFPTENEAFSARDRDHSLDKELCSVKQVTELRQGTIVRGGRIILKPYGRGFERN